MSQSSSSSVNDPSKSPSEAASPPTNGRGDGAVAMASAADVPAGQYQLEQSDHIDDDRTNADIFETAISEEVYEQNYQYGTDTHVPDTWYRNARYLASVEADEDRWTKKFYQLLSGHGLPTGPFPFTPGGRIFANAGTSLGKATLINCLAGETLVLTSEGRKPIEDLAGTEPTLLTRNGKWVEAPVKSYGKQPLRKVTLSRNGQERVIYATPNHRWYVGTKATSGYEVVETDDLQSHHRLERVHSRRHTSVSPSPVGIARGFTFGDGSLVSSSPGAAANVNLVGDKDESLQGYFDSFASSEYDYSTGVTRYRGLPDAWTETPVDLNENSATLYGWAAGYFAADGCVSEKGEVIMDSCTREHIEHFIDVIEVLGIDHYGLKTQERTSNLTDEASTRYYVRLNPTSLREEFFVLDEHKIRFREHGNRSLTYHWHVESVEETDRYETVYCAEVPEEKAFALDNGILTGNCFVSGFQGYDQDSMDEIQAELTRQAKILASEGGYGFCAHVMRPRGSRIGGVGSMTPGAVQMLDVWNEQAATIVAGSGMQSDRDDVKDKIRKGAQMVTMGVWHPDIVEFIKAKQEPGRLHKFNMSVLVSDEFMEAVANDDEWALRFPDFEGEPEFYREHWDGDLAAYEEKGGTVNVWKDPATGEKAIYEAREIWDLIMDSTYNRNEPGVIFVDTINRENNLNYVEHINATNPCVAEGTLVNTPDGYERVENVSVGDEILTTIGHEPVDEIEVHQDYPVYRVRFSDGGEQLVTAAHRYHVKEPGDKAVTDKRLDEIEEGATIRVRGNHQPLDLDESEYERGLKRGVLVGDGCYTEKALESHNGDALAISSSASDAAYNDNVQTLFGTDRDLDTSSEGKAVKIWVTEAEELVDELNLTQAKAPTKTVDVASMTRSEMLGVLDGLIASDGNMNLKSNHPQLRFMTTSEELAQEFRQMMLSFGAHATITDSGPPKSTINGRKVEGNHTKYTVQVSGESLRNFAQHSRLDEIHPEKGERLLKAQTDFVLSGNYWWAKIESIEEAGTADVYDLYCEKSDTWITSGYVQRGCGEQVLPVGGVCLLGNFNLTQFVDAEKQEINYDLLDDLIPSAVRFLDNVNDLSYVPLEEQQWNLQKKRRIGLGHFGDGSALMMMKKRYGSEEGVRVMREFQEHLANKAYQASARLAEEKEPFPLFDKDEYLSNPFVQRLSDETKEMIGDLGLRNSHLLSIQPTGNTSTLANAPSSGIEPVFMHSYIRTSEQPALPDEVTAPEMSPRAYSAGDTVNADGTTWAAEEHGDEVVLRCADEGYTQWQIHPTRGICKDEKVEDYAVRHMKERGDWDPEADWAVTTRDLDVDDHLRQMEALAPFIDSSMSKCVVEGTRIQTSRGPVRIEEFYDGEQTPDTFSDPAVEAKASDGQGNMKPITKAYYGGEKPCVEVNVSTGEEIKCSRTHKLLTPSGWKPAAELEVGEHVAINHAPVDTDLPLQPVPQPDFTNAISRSFPTHLTEAFATFLGMWFADGSVNKNSIRIHEKDEEVRGVAVDLLDELFGECKTQTDSRTGVRTHEVHSRPLAQYFKEQYGDSASDKTPPEALFRSPASVKKAFLNGLTLDGYVDTTQSERLTVYEGYSKSLRDAAAQLLAELGVRVHLREKDVSKTGAANSTTFSVRAYLQSDALSPIESHKREYSTRAFGTTKRRVQEPERYMDLPATDHPDYIGRRNLRRSLKESGVVQQSTLDALGVGYDDTLGWAKVTSRRDIGRQPVYDVEVADTHSYRVGNIVSHNTVNVPQDYPFDEFKDLYRKAWETGSIKGVTTYRAGTMSAVLSGDDEEDGGLPRTEAPDRPEELPCAVHRVRYRGDHWTVLVGFLDDNPYEVFAFKADGEAPLFGDPAERINEGIIRKNESRHYSLLTPEGDVVIEDITSHMPSDEARVETRLVSTALRHGSKVDFLVEQLEKAEGSIASFGQAMAKALSAHADTHEVTCDKCGSSNVRHVEGCMMCADCGHSRCS